MEQQEPHVAIVISPGMSHRIAVVEFSKRLVHHHNLSVTILVPTIGASTKAQAEFLESLPKNISHVFLPTPRFEDLPEDSRIETTIFLAVSRCLSSIRDTLKFLTAKTALVALITDLFASDAFEVAKEFNIPRYIYFFASAVSYSFGRMLPKLDEKFSCEFKDLPEPVKIPGCVPVHGRDLMVPVQDRTNDAYKLILYHSKRICTLPEGVLINSFVELEEGALQMEEPGRNGGERSDFLEWLDKKPRGSVLFVSFGCGGSLSYAQLNELEMSGRNILWVVRTPHDKSPSASFFFLLNPSASFINVQNENVFDFLPEGFLDRSKGQSLVVPSWAPQVEILARGSTGCFLSHCKWNLALESIVHVCWVCEAQIQENCFN